ncbi:fibronectin type III-like domain-contianing protein [Nocardioides lijunqiniae]|uniref:fibronectin type III-like domain-contianing protein n=1 Tax=Nocardioides lijunqiniae TaxID=2760832 RepID=UPI002227AA44|nr:fibronectin type III-like domain-contianing protein [Nocardioides lijunqiniae]
MRAGFSRGDQRVLRVRLRVTNVGNRSGAAVPQIYVGRLPTVRVRTAPRQLAGFARVDLRSGRSRQVTVRVPREAYSFWDSGRDRWVTPRGRLRIFVGRDALTPVASTTVRVR